MLAVLPGVDIRCHAVSVFTFNRRGQTLTLPYPFPYPLTLTPIRILTLTSAASLTWWAVGCSASWRRWSAPALSDELVLPSSPSLFLAMTVAYLVADCVSLTWSITLPLTSTLALALAL
jgi:hypothetical protein